MRKNKKSAGLARVTLSEKVYRAGYVVRHERWAMGNDPAVDMQCAYTPSGDYIGNPKDARWLVVHRGIRPQLRTPDREVCSIGYNAAERKWYGWSHRAICGFRVGSMVRKGDCLAESIPVGTEAETLLDAKRFAEAFAESVG